MPEIAYALHAPDFASGDRSQWIQGPALAVPAARGGVVLVDFWESTCVNCLRTLPYLIAWYERYVGRGLLVVGVHTPEFAFTADPAHVARAVAAEKIPYAVLSDPDRATWERFANRVWPAKYLIDARGYLRYETFGEGNFEETERWIQRLLGEAGDPGPWPEPWTGPAAVGSGAGEVCRPSTRETYVGWHRGRLFAPEGYRPGEVVRHSGLASAEIPLGGFTARGAWRHEAEYLESAETGAEIELHYEAAGVNLVLDPEGVAEILLDGSAVPEAERGADVRAAEAGAVATLATWDRGRLVRLIDGGHGDHRLTLRFAAPGARAYAFSFGRCG